VDHRQYLIPLYTRGWGISFKVSKAKVTDGSIVDRDDSSSPQPTAHLVVRYKFENYDSAVAFFNGIAKIASSENVSRQHSISIATINQVPFAASSPDIDNRECQDSFSCFGHTNRLRDTSRMEPAKVTQTTWDHTSRPSISPVNRNVVLGRVWRRREYALTPTA
jgi:pterin-4a-carbinolamine dehydratase